MPIAQVEASGNAGVVRLEPGPVGPDAAFLPSVIAVQYDGTEVGPVICRFCSLIGASWVRDTLQLLPA